jgi:PIN domain nuclease of toxin-antitoxin system
VKPFALVDTHALVWYLNGDGRLSPTALRLMDDPSTRLLFSAASIVEIAIKVQLNKLSFKEPPQRVVPRTLRRIRASVLPVRGRHAMRMLKLPRHHSDPFDRMILAQAHVEGLPIISADAAFAKYPVKLIW